MNLIHKTKPVSREAKVLYALRKAGNYGMWNYEVARVGGLCWHRRITDLRKEGFNIQTVRLDKGNFKYYINESER